MKFRMTLLVAATGLLLATGYGGNSCHHETLT
jgi:hypothetical protein